MKEVEVFIVASSDQIFVEEIGHKKYIEGQGCFWLAYKGKGKGFYIPTNEVTPNRVLIYCLLEALRILKEPCKVKVLTRGTIGNKSFHKPNWRHYDLSSKFFEIVKDKELEYSFIVENNHPTLLTLKDELLRNKQENLLFKKQIYI